jgi:tetratricopeptide (TPR) repeat protein
MAVSAAGTAVPSPRGAEAAGSALVLDEVKTGSLVEWKERYDPRSINPRFGCEEVPSPFDGSTALRTWAKGSTFDTCETKWVRRVYATGPRRTDGAVVEAFLAFAFDGTTYNLPSVKLELLDERGQAVAGRVYFGKGIIGSFNRGQLPKTGYRELPSASGLQRFDLAREFGSERRFSAIAVSLMNYACQGENSVVFDHLALRPGPGLSTAATVASQESTAADKPELPPTLQIVQWIGDDTWSWNLTRRGTTTVYDAVAVSNQTGLKSAHVFELRSFDRKTVVFNRPDAGVYTGTIDPAGRAIFGRTNFGGAKEGWRAMFGSAVIFPSPHDRPGTRAAREAYETGVRLRSEGRAKEAVSALDRAIESDPGFADSWRQRALAFLALSRNTEALSDFDRALQLEPGNARALVGRATAKNALGDTAGGLSDANRAVELDPTSYANAYFTRGSILYGMKDFAGALLDFGRAANRDPAAFFYIFNRGLARAGLGDQAGARLDFSRYLQRDPKGAFAAAARQRLVQTKDAAPLGAAAASPVPAAPTPSPAPAPRPAAAPAAPADDRVPTDPAALSRTDKPFQAPLAAQERPGLDHYFCDWDNLSPLLGAFSDGSAKTFSRTILGITSEPPVSISFARDGTIYAGAGELFCPALRDLLSDAVAKGDRWSLEIFVNSVNSRRLVSGFLDSALGGLFRTKLSIEPSQTKDQLALSVINENFRGGTAGIVTLDFKSTAASLRGARIPAPSAVSSRSDKLDLSKILSLLGAKDKTADQARSKEGQDELAALAQRAEEIDETSTTSGLLDEALKEAGGFPFALGKAPVVTEFPGFPAEEPCNQAVWTLPIVAWSTSHFTQVFKQGVTPSSSSTKRPPARILTPEEVENYQKVIYRAMESVRLMCGATTAELAPAFNKVWAPFLDQPNAEALDYFNLLTPLLDRYWGLHSKIEGDLEAGRQAWQQAGVAAGQLDESGTRAALDNGFMIMDRLKKEREEAARIIGEIVSLGDPPNPLQAKCDARGRHQAALDAVGPSAPSAGSSWVMVDYVMKDDFSRADGYKKESTSIIYDRYEMQWIHPPGRLEPGAMIELPVNAVRTGLDRHEQTAILDVPRMFQPGIKGVLSMLTQVRYPTEDYFHFVFMGGVSTWLEGEKALLEIRLFPHAGVNRTRLEPYERERADWAGERIYRYEWDATGTRRPFDPGPASGSSVAGLPTVAAAPPATAASSIQSSPEVAAAIVEHQQTIGIIRRNLERASAELAREKDPARRKSLEDEVVMHQSNLQEEQDRIESLRTGRTVHTRTVWEQREEQRFLDKIRTEVDLLATEAKYAAGLSKMANNLVNDRDATKHKIIQDVGFIYDSGLSLEERVKRLKEIGASVQIRAENEQKTAHEVLQVAEDRLWYAEKIQTAANLGIMFGALFVPGAGFVAMGYGFGTGWAEGGPAKAAENTIRALNPVIDVAWAGLDGYYAMERDTATGRLHYRGWSGAAENMAITFVMNKAFEKLGQRLQSRPPADLPGMGQTGALKGSREAGKGKVKPEPRVDAFEENVTRYKNELARLDRGFDDLYPKTADGKIDMSHPNYGKAKEMHDKAAAQVRDKYGVLAKREDLKGELSASTKKYEDLIPAEARKRDGTVDTQHPEYQRVKGEWEADMKAIRAKHNEGYEARWKEQQKIIDDNGLKITETNPEGVAKSGGEPKSIMSDIDLTATDMASGEKFVKSMRDKGHKALEFSDRWVLPGTDTTIWKPNARPEKIGSSAHSASVDYFASRGSDKFPTEGGVAYTTGNAAGIEDPAGAVISNLKKATEAGIGGSTAEPDYHIIGKSCDKAAEVANKYNPEKPIRDPEFFQKAQGVREHKTPEEAGVMTFGNPAEAKKNESRQFLSRAQEHMDTAMKSGEAASQKRNAEDRQMIADLEETGNKKTANRIREMLVRARVSNEAAMQSLSRQDPAFISRIHRGLASVPPLTPPPSPDRKFGYGWLLESTKKLNAEPRPDTGGTAAPPLADTMKAASLAIDNEALPVFKADSPEKTYFQSIKNAFDAGGTNPVYAARAVRAASGYEMTKVAADMASLGARKKGSGGSRGGRGGGIGNPLAPAPGFTNAPPLEDPDLAGMKAVWVYHRLPISFVEVGPLGFSNTQRNEKQIAPRVAIVPSSEVFWTGSTLAATLKGGDPKYLTESKVSIAADPKGGNLAVVQTDENSRSQRQESWGLCRVRGLPLVEKKVFGKNPRFYAWVYRSEGDALRPLLEQYDNGFNSSWEEGRWKGRFQAIRWEDKINLPRFTVVLCSVHPSKFDEGIRTRVITAEQRAEFETWIDRQRGWEPIVIPKK